MLLKYMDIIVAPSRQSTESWRPSIDFEVFFVLCKGVAT